MGKIMMNGIQYGVGGIEQAKDISYDNTESGATATDVQGALDELNAGLMPYPDYANRTDITSSFPSQPTSSTTASFTLPVNALIYFTADKTSQGFTLYANVDGHAVATIPAHVAFGGVALTFPVKKGSVLSFKTDSTGATWTIRMVAYFPLVLG